MKKTGINQNSEAGCPLWVAETRTPTNPASPPKTKARLNANIPPPLNAPAKRSLLTVFMFSVFIALLSI
jgi:hypothetical protein